MTAQRRGIAMMVFALCRAVLVARVTMTMMADGLRTIGCTETEYQGGFGYEL